MTKNKSWLSFQDIMEEWDATECEVLRAFENGLHPYHTLTMEELPFTLDELSNAKGKIGKFTWSYIQTFGNIASRLGKSPLLVYYEKAFSHSDCVRFKSSDVEKYKTIKQEIEINKELAAVCGDDDHHPESRSPDEISLIAYKMKYELKKSRREIAKQLFPGDFQNAASKKDFETLKKRVDRLADKGRLRTPKFSRPTSDPHQHRDD